MRSLRLRLRTTCAACGNPIPLTAAKLALVCPTCDEPKSLAPSAFGWLMEARPPSFLGTVSTLPTSVHASRSAQRVVVGEANWAPVACGACGAEIADHLLAEAMASGGVTCRCGRAIPIRRVPAELDPERWWMAFVGESTVADVPAATAPVRFACPNCGAALLVDGTTRTPACSHCATRPYLSDELWRAVRPTPKAEPFHLWVDPSWYERWAQLKSRRVRAMLLTFVGVVLGMAAGASVLTSYGVLFQDGKIFKDVPRESTAWYHPAMFSLTFSWMVALLVMSLVGARMQPRRPRD